MFHTSLTDLYDEDYENFVLNDLIENAEQLFYSFGVTNEQAVAIENRTQQQRESPEWHEQRCE